MARKLVTVLIIRDIVGWCSALRREVSSPEQLE